MQSTIKLHKNMLLTAVQPLFLHDAPLVTSSASVKIFQSISTQVQPRKYDQLHISQFNTDMSETW